MLQKLKNGPLQNNLRFADMSVWRAC